VNATQVTVDAGTLLGALDDGIRSFKGVPYAAPPVGERRWRAPAPVEPWTGVRPALEFAAAAPQTPDTGVVSSEDCAYLNVWAPEDAHDAPVMVWIHGGAHRVGSPALYDGAELAQSGVVVVSMAYRLGRFGYFAHPAITADAAPGELLGNYGLADQIAALEWVQRNIRAVGGDPGNVTVLGHSSGGIDVLLLCMAEPARGIFHRGIVHSGGGWFPPYSLEEAERVGHDDLTRAYGELSIAELRALSAEDLCISAGIIWAIVDGAVVRDDLTRLIAEGRVAHVPLIMGAVSGEDSLLGSPESPAITRGAYDDESLARLRELYPDLDETGALARAFGHALTAAPARWVARHWPSPVYLYYFDQAPPRAPLGRPGHGDELDYLFAAGPEASTEADLDVARDLRARWVAFASTGDPNHAAGVPWLPGADEWLLFADGRTRLVPNLLGPQLDFFDSFVDPVAALDGIHPVEPLNRLFTG
jgi:para-nitrobenzyl esterase